MKYRVSVDGKTWTLLENADELAGFLDGIFIPAMEGIIIEVIVRRGE